MAAEVRQRVIDDPAGGPRLRDVAADGDHPRVGWLLDRAGGRDHGVAVCPEGIDERGSDPLGPPGDDRDLLRDGHEGP